MTKPVADRLRELEGFIGLDGSDGRSWAYAVSELASIRADVVDIAEVFRASGETHSEIEGGTDYSRFWSEIAARLSMEKP